MHIVFKNEENLPPPLKKILKSLLLSSAYSEWLWKGETEELLNNDFNYYRDEFFEYVKDRLLGRKGRGFYVTRVIKGGGITQWKVIEKGDTQIYGWRATLAEIEVESFRNLVVKIILEGRTIYTPEEIIDFLDHFIVEVL